MLAWIFVGLMMAFGTAVVIGTAVSILLIPRPRRRR